MTSVGVFTRAYRYEDCISKAIESILNQSYRDIKYYILVSDETYPYIMKYQNEDKRINIVQNDSQNSGIIDYINKIAIENDYVCVLDADDWYESSFIEDMLAFIHLHNLDIALCGSIFENEKGEYLGERAMKSDLIWESIQFPIVFPYVHCFFRTIWGKIISSKLINEEIVRNYPSISEYGGYGGDTILSLMLAKKAKKFGIKRGSLHHYRMSYNSSSNKLNPNRLLADNYMYKLNYEFIRHYGPVNKQNNSFLAAVYCASIADTISLIMNQNVEERREKQLEDYFQCIDLNVINNCKDKKAYFNNIYKLVFTDDQNIDLSNVNAWYKIYRCLVEDAYKLSLDEFIVISMITGGISKFIAKDFVNIYRQVVRTSKTNRGIIKNVLKNLCSNEIIIYIMDNFEDDLFYDCEVIITKLLNEDYVGAFNEIKMEVENKSIYAESLLEIYKMTAAYINDQDYFVQASILQTNWYYDNEKFEQYQYMLQELREMGLEVMK